MKFVCSLIVVENIDRSRRFYESCLDQTVQMDHGENLFFGGFAVHLREHFEKLVGAGTVSGKRSMELYFEHEDLYSLEKRVREYGAEFLHGITEQPWGQRVMRFYDPDGHLIEVGEPL